MVLDHRRLPGGHGVADGEYLRRHHHWNRRRGRRQPDAAGWSGRCRCLPGRSAHRVRLVLHPVRPRLVGGQHRHRVLRGGTGRVPIEPSAAVAANDPGVEGRLSDRIRVLGTQAIKQTIDDDSLGKLSNRSPERTRTSFVSSVGQQFCSFSNWLPTHIVTVTQADQERKERSMRRFGFHY